MRLLDRHELGVTHRWCPAFRRNRFAVASPPKGGTPTGGLVGIDWCTVFFSSGPTVRLLDRHELGVTHRWCPAFRRNRFSAAAPPKGGTPTGGFVGIGSGLTIASTSGR